MLKKIAAFTQINCSGPTLLKVKAAKSDYFAF